MCTHLEPKLGQKSYFYVFNHLTCYLIMFDFVCVNYLCLIIYHVCLSLYGIFGLFHNLSYEYDLIAIFSFFNIICLIVFYFFPFILWCDIKYVVCVISLSAWCMFRLRIRAFLINFLIKYDLATHNGDRPTSWAVLDA